MRFAALLTLIFSLLFGVIACKHKVPEPSDEYGNFPEPVGKIFITKCATSGCHNSKSYENAGDIRLDRWEYLFSGIDNSTPVVPYSPDYSPLLYYINTDSSLGLIAPGTRMPANAPPLSREEYITIRDWIAEGAPDKYGNIPFASEPETRQKIYITQQGCDLVAVIDAKTKMVMRYIKVGMNDGTEAPHNVKFTADGKYAYVCFSNGNYLQKIDAATDKVIGSVPLSSGLPGSTSFNVLCVSPDGRQVLVSNWVTEGSVLLVDMADMKVVKNYNAGLVSPHGVAANASFDTFFVTGQSGNIVYRIPKEGDIDTVVLDDAPPTTVSKDNVTPDPHDLIMAPDYSKYFVTCENTGQVIVVDAHNNKILGKIPVGKFAQELAISKKLNKIFVTCMEEPSNLEQDKSGNYKGTVAVIDINDYTAKPYIIKAKFNQPHGIVVDDINGQLYVASRNTTGVEAHHPSACEGENGYYQVFDLNSGYTTYTGSDRRYEISVQPYSADVRFKKAY